MKVSRGVLMVALVLMQASMVNAAKLTDTVYGQWITDYLTSFDQLLLLPWRNIYWYTWLILCQWILCSYFPDIGTTLLGALIPGGITNVDSDEVRTEQCNDGMANYFASTMYGGGVENRPFAYFKTFKTPEVK